MATNTLTCNGIITVTIGNSINLPLAVNVAITGSTDVRKTQAIALGSWQALDTSSLSNIRYLWADNISTGSINVATDGAGSNVISRLSPNDNLLIPWSGSLTLYAQAYISASALQYYAVNA